MRGVHVYSTTMGQSVIGRSVLLSLLALSGCAGTSARTSPQDAEPLRATVRGVYESVARGDEAGYRRLVGIAPDDTYSDALTATMFESIRLHQAVESLPAPATGPAPATRPGASLAAVDYRDNARAMLKAVQGWTFTVRGDRATIDDVADRPGAPALRRVNGRWVLAPSAWDTRRDTSTYRLAVAEERALAKALATARVAVERGDAKTVEAVNDILRNLLTEQPTTRP
jgi:hypothetical protein